MQLLTTYLLPNSALTLNTVISIIIYPIPSDLGSQDDSSQASSMVGDHVRSPGTERC